MRAHELETGRSRVLFGAGRVAELAAELDALGVRRLLAIVDVPVDITRGLPVVARIEEVRGHVPVELADAARRVADEHAADGLLAVGGGSATGLAKAVALTHRLPIAAVPTTYAGSEMTPIWGITTDARKATGTDYQVLPRLVVYDPELQLTLPARVSAASGVNALAHAVEALWAPGADPVSSAVAEEAIRVLPTALKRIAAEPRDLAARACALRGAWLAGVALAGAGTALHHGLCHILGGTFDLPHAEVHAVLLPHVVGVVAPDAPEAIERMTRALGGADPVTDLRHLGAALNLPRSLQDLGMDESQLERAVGLAAQKGLAAPRPLDEEALRRLLRDAFAGAERERRVA